MKNNKTKEIFVPARYINDDGTFLDFTGLYEVSNLGRVRSLDYNHTGKAKILSPYAFECKDGTILYKVGLCKDGKQYNKQVHRLVLSSFDQEGWSPGTVVDHIIARTSGSCDDRLSNLHWVDYSQNRTTEHCNELMSRALTNRKDLSKRVKATDLTTGEITEYPSANEAGRSLGINPKLPAACIKLYNGYYKKLNLHFEYIN